MNRGLRSTIGVVQRGVTGTGGLTLAEWIVAP
jgi:hypothetical protein